MNAMACATCVTLTSVEYSAASPSWSMTLPRTVCVPGAPAVQLALAFSRYGAAVVTGANPIRARIAAAAALGKIRWRGYDASGPYR